MKKTCKFGGNMYGIVVVLFSLISYSCKRNTTDYVILQDRFTTTNEKDTECVNSFDSLTIGVFNNFSMYKKSFSLEKTTKFKIICSGEGFTQSLPGIKNIYGILLDYGWIENDTGNVIWKMDINIHRYDFSSISNRSFAIR